MTSAAPPPPARRRAEVGVLLLVAALLAVAVGPLAALRGEGPLLGGGPVLPWPVVALAFGLVESVVMHVQSRREAAAISLSELPLVLALFLAAPVGAVVGRLVAMGVVTLGLRRSSPLKAAFNAALVVAETAVATLVFRALVPAAAAGPSAWAAALAAVAAEVLLAFAAVTLVIALHEGPPARRTLLVEVRDQLLLSCMTAVVALVAVASLRQDPRNAVLLAAVAGVVLTAYRAYAALFDRHLSLERMYGFSQVVSRSPEVDDVLRSVLLEAQQILRAEQAEVVVQPGRAGAAVLVRLAADGSLTRRAQEQPDDPWLADRLLRAGRAVLLPRGTREPGARRTLERRGWREAILVPLHGSTGVFGSLAVADRMGDVRGLDEQDVLLLETIANHASVAIQNGRLIDTLRHDALHDSLTGLPNRTLLRQLVERSLATVPAGHAVAVVVLDLDGFKDVNDSLGHQRGDDLLVEVAARLTSAVGRTGTVARLGGDEFAVLLPACPDEAAATRAARRALSSFAQPVDLDGTVVEIGASLGLALAPQHGSDVSTLLKKADVAMYDAKSTTGGLRVYDPALDASSERRLVLVAELRSALHAGEVVVHVQPQADLRTGAVRSVEALARWTHPELGAVRPDEFVAVAERSGLIGALTTTVLEQALEACAQWRRSGLELSVAVNLSTRSLLDVDVVDEVRRLLRRHGLPGGALTLEVTESGVMADPGRAVALLLELRELGVRLSIDDFGTGYSSLAYLKRLPVHEVKIDKSFVLEMDDEGEDGAIVRSIVDLGRHLGLDVVAEGVETAQAWDRLRGLGCTTAQGWHLARPMPVAELPAWLARASAGTPPLLAAG